MESNLSQSIQIANEVVESNISDLDFPFLISFPRTGSHWLRMIMELYFEKPSLVRVFYYSNVTGFTCYHRHDEELNVTRKNVIYLYRSPVDTIYSQMAYCKEDLKNSERVVHWANSYGRHLQKWLLDEAFTTKKTILTYEGLTDDMASEFIKVCDHFNKAFQAERLFECVRKVTKCEVQNKTWHDPQVIDNSEDYAKNKELFVNENGKLIGNTIVALDSRLQNFL